MSHELGRQIGQRFEKINKVARTATLGAIIFGGTAIPSAATQAQENPQPTDVRSINSASTGFPTSRIFLGEESEYPLESYFRKRGYNPNDNPAPKIDLKHQVVVAIGESQLTDRRVTDTSVNSEPDSVIRIKDVTFDSGTGKLKIEVIEFGSQICEDQLSDNPTADRKSIAQSYEPLEPGDLAVITLGVSTDSVKKVEIERKQFGENEEDGCIVTTEGSARIVETADGKVLERTSAVDVITKPNTY